MRTVVIAQRAGVMIVSAVGIAALLLCLPALADRMTSTDFVLNGNANSAFGGTGGSTDYGMFSTGGEPVIGKGASGSYILGGGYTAQLQSSIQMTVQPGGLLGFWNFDETTGTLYSDGSATRADATRTGNGFSSVTGKLANALSSDGSDAAAYARVPAASIQPSSITVEAWIKPSAVNAADNICSYYASVTYNRGPFEFYIDGATSAGTLSFSINNAAYKIATGAADAMSVGSWYHVAATYDSSTGVMAIYINGIQKATQTFSPTVINYTYGNTANELACFNNPRWSGEGLQGALDHLKIFNRALRADEVKSEYDAQNAGTPTSISLGSVTPGASNTALQDVIIRTDSAAYGVTVSQDHDLQKGSATIPAISSGSIASPASWTEGTTKGLGFTLINAPSIDSKWSSGSKYAAIPGSSTSFYTRSSHSSSDTIDVINSRLRLDTTTSQESGSYSNTVTYTSTTIP